LCRKAQSSLSLSNDFVQRLFISNFIAEVETMAVPNLWRTKKQRYSLQGEVCPACQNMLFPPRQVCPYCHHGAVNAVHGAQLAEASAASQPYMMIFTLPQTAELAVGDD
jgi:Rubredoxin-like zinc ribbon domain (DUF35_N)